MPVLKKKFDFKAPLGYHNDDGCIYDGAGDLIADVCGFASDDDAEYIVHSVNNHDKLVSALELLYLITYEGAANANDIKSVVKKLLEEVR